MQQLKDIVDGKTNLKQDEISELLGMMRDANKDKPNIVRIPANHVYFVGDLHGDITTLNVVKNLFLHSTNSLVFLGDYVDRGPAQIETVNLVFALSLLYPGRVTVLRGNHETEQVSSRYGFFMEVGRKFSHPLYLEYCETFKTLPLAGMSKNGVFCCHGGVPEGLESKEQLQEIERQDINLVHPIAYQLLWNDPRDEEYHFQANLRGGGSRLYGKLAFDEFAENLDVSLMLRSHEAYRQGFKQFFNGRLVSVFSASYRGQVAPQVVKMTTNLQVEAIPLS